MEANGLVSKDMIDRVRWAKLDWIDLLSNISITKHFRIFGPDKYTIDTDIFAVVTNFGHTPKLDPDI